MHRALKLAIALLVFVLVGSFVLKTVAWVKALRRAPLFASEATIRERMEANGALTKLKAWAAERVAAQEWRGMDQEWKECPVKLDDLLVWDIRPCWIGPRLPVEFAAPSTMALLVSPAGAGPLGAAATWMVGRHQKLTQIDVVFTRGLRGSGLLIGPPGFTPEDYRCRLGRWCDQVWFYDGLD